MKPLQQLYALVLEKMHDFRKKWNIPAGEITSLTWNKEINKLKEKWPEPEKFEKKYDELREKEVKALIFEQFIKK